MASVDLLVPFALATLSYAAIPGPGTVYIAAQAAIRDPRAALWGAFGLHVGGYAIVIGSAAGLTVLFSAVPIVYEVLKLLGAGYVVWLGVRMIFCRTGTDGGNRQGRRDTRQPATFSQGILVEVLNPTTVAFYVAFLPQFIAPGGDFPVWLQFLVLGALVNLIFSLGDIVAILVATKVRAKAPGNVFVRRVAAWVGGSVLITLGARLATERT